VGKKSEAKATVGGRKVPVRAVRNGTATEERIYVDETPPPSPWERPLLVPLVTEGQPNPAFRGPDGVLKARDRRAASVAELPTDAHRLSRGEPALDTVYV
jgi:nicotinate phosphoribosyltransferase